MLVDFGENQARHHVRILVVRIVIDIECIVAFVVVIVVHLRVGAVCGVLGIALRKAAGHSLEIFEERQ